MGGASSWLVMLSIVAFFASVWMAAKVSKMIGMSSIVLEVAVGLVLGPDLLKLIPGELSQSNAHHMFDCESSLEKQLKYAQKGAYHCDLAAYLEADKYDNFFDNFHNGAALYDDVLAMAVPEMCSSGSGGSSQSSGSSGERRLAGRNGAGLAKAKDYNSCVIEACSLDRSIAAATVPDVFTLFGHIGVAMMIFESGMHFDFEQAKTVGPLASVVAVGGTFLPIVAGTALAMGFGFDMMEGLSCGVALAPTSVGIALKLLHEANALNLYFGQAVMTAAFVDDVLSLILFNILFNIGPCMTAMTFAPTVIGVVFMIVAVIFAMKGFPSLVSFILSKVPETKPHSNFTKHDQVKFFMMVGTLILYGHITYLCGTHLWGAFIAGMCFANDDHAHHIWVNQVKRNTVWFLRCFFACTLAWSIPVASLFSLDAFWKGTLMGIGPCILTKVCCGPFMGDARWVIGWAMVGRAEFAYFIAIMANSQKMMSDDLFAILVWALIYATIFAPLIFKKVLSNYMAKIQEQGPVWQEAEPRHSCAGTTTHHISMWTVPGQRHSAVVPRGRRVSVSLDKPGYDTKCMKQRIAELEAQLEIALNNKEQPPSPAPSSLLEDVGSLSAPATLLNAGSASKVATLEAKYESFAAHV